MSAPKYALDAANMALDIMTNDVHSLFEKGLALETLQRSKEANKTFDFILSLQPKSEKDVFFIGQVLFKRQKVQEAIHFYKQVRRKLPSFHPGKFQNLNPEQKAEWDRIFSQP
jgi:tetratricopeptide (TPR) repeat protein